MLRHWITFIITFGALAGSSLLTAQENITPWEDPMANGIAANVEGRIITFSEIRREMAPLIPQVIRESRTRSEMTENLNNLAKEILQNLIDRILIVREYEQQEKFKIPQSYVENEFDDTLIRDFDNDRSRFLEYLRSQNMTIREFRRDLQENIIVSVMRSQMRRSMSKISPEKIEQYYVENKIQFFQEEQVHLRQIVLRAKSQDLMNLTLEKAKNIIYELDQGARFIDMATEHSEDTMADKGGDWGWVQRSDIRKELGDVAFNLKANEYSREPIVMGNHVFILYVEEIRPEGIQPLEEVRELIENRIMTSISREAQSKWVNRLREKAYIRYYI
ncbi:MAG: peptidyl-prolyl cis-trans isomerase [Puniceicoccaceae bacterium]